MSLIDFESSTKIKEKRDWEREVRKSILEKAKKKYESEEKKKQRAKETGEDKWLLPSVEDKIDGKKSKKKKKEKKRKKSKKKRSSSSSDSSEEEQWVEKDVSAFKTPSTTKREDWMQVTSLLGTYSRDDLKAAKKTNPETADKKKTEENKPGTHSRELNPYYKDGGSGLPSSNANQDSAVSPSGYDVEWLKKALRRAEDEAKLQGKTLEEVAATRWGSLEKFYDLLHEAEKKAKSCSLYKQTERRSNDGGWKDDRNRRDSKESKYNHTHGRRRRNSSSSGSNSGEDRNSRHFVKRARENKHLEQKHQNRRQQIFKPMLRPNSDDEDSGRLIERATSSSLSTGRNWRKKKSEPVKPVSSSSSEDECKEESRQEMKTISPTIEKPCKASAPTKILTDKEMNQLAAKMTKAELLGNSALAAKLKEKLEAARKARESSSFAPSESRGVIDSKEEVVVLTRTDSKGFTRPISHSDSKQEGKKKKPKLLTHDNEGKRVSFFPDDDRYNLKQMFEKEKMTSSEEQNLMFERAAMRNIERLTEDYDMDDVFVSKSALKEDSLQQQERDRKMAIKEHQMTTKILENCSFCFDNKEMKKHLIVSLGSKCYLSLPAHEPLTEGHCIIAPISHVQSSTRADEDLWEEVNVFRKSLVRMLEAKGEDCVFFETCRNYKNLPHMAIHCVPLDRETGDFAPIYFKKAIQECEGEWAQNKKLVDLKGKDVRKAVPKELPYFFVDFGLSPGYAHVIEDERTFRNNFAQEIIGGMIDADHNLWRKPKLESFEAQRRRVIAFEKYFKEYDPNR